MTQVGFAAAYCDLSLRAQGRQFLWAGPFWWASALGELAASAHWMFKSLRTLHIRVFLSVTGRHSYPRSVGLVNPEPGHVDRRRAAAFDFQIC
jgi:hypothetical protein